MTVEIYFPLTINKELCTCTRQFVSNVTSESLIGQPAVKHKRKGLREASSTGMYYISLLNSLLQLPTLLQEGKKGVHMPLDDSRLSLGLMMYNIPNQNYCQMGMFQILQP